MPSANNHGKPHTNLLIVEAHAVEDEAEVITALVSIGQTTVGSAVGDVSVLAASAPRDDRTSHFLDSNNS